MAGIAPEIGGGGRVSVFGESDGYVGVDLTLANRALRERWPLTPEMREFIVLEAMKIAMSSHDERNRLGAMRVLVSADRTNSVRENTATPQQVNHLHAHVTIDERRARVAAIAERLGVDCLSAAAEP